MADDYAGKDDARYCRPLILMNSEGAGARGPRRVARRSASAVLVYLKGDKNAKNGIRILAKSISEE